MKNEKSKFRESIRTSKCQSFGSQKGSNNREIRLFFVKKRTATIPTYALKVLTHEKIGRKVVNVTHDTSIRIKNIFPWKKKRYKNWFTDFYDIYNFIIANFTDSFILQNECLQHLLFCMCVSTLIIAFFLVEFIFS